MFTERLNIIKLSNHSNTIHKSRKAKRDLKKDRSRSLIPDQISRKLGKSSFPLALKGYDLRVTLLASLHPPTYLLLGEEGLF